MVADYYPYLLEACRENVLPLTSRCNLGCVFCSNKQNPAQIFTYKLPALPQTTIRQLIPLLNPQEKVIIGESATKLDEGEPFTHPEILSVLKMLRAALPKTMLAITTNGTLLTEKVIRELAALTPLELTVSPNSATPQGRRILMHDEAPNRALQAVDGLARHDLPFHGSLVAMPHLVGFEDIKETVFFLARHGALTIRIFLPGYTKFAPEKLKFPLQLWEQIVFYAQEWSNLLDLPVIPEPLIPDNLEPCIWGVIPDSPAKRAGLQADDLIKEGRIFIQKDRVYLVPEGYVEQKGLRTLRQGLFLGEMKKRRFVPSQSLALSLKSTDYDSIINLSVEDSDVIRYLKCETLTLDTKNKNGWQLVCVDGFPLGWGKLNNGSLKNMYLPGWRWM